MTLREADEAAQKGLPIIHTLPGRTPIEYRRITRTGYRYNENHERFGFVELLDKSGTITYAELEHCTLKQENKIMRGNETEVKTL